MDPSFPKQPLAAGVLALLLRETLPAASPEHTHFYNCLGPPVGVIVSSLTLFTRSRGYVLQNGFDDVLDPVLFPLALFAQSRGSFEHNGVDNV